MEHWSIGNHRQIRVGKLAFCFDFKYLVEIIMKLPMHLKLPIQGALLQYSSTPILQQIFQY